jgi:hypothetical protein
MSRQLILPPHGVTLKLQRAQWQLEQIETLLASFTQQHVAGVTPEGNLDGNALTLSLPAGTSAHEPGLLQEGLDH